MSATDPFQQHEALVAQLRANPPVAPDRLRQRVLQVVPAPRSRSRKLVLVVVPLAIVGAVAAALVHGFVNSGSPRAQDKAAMLPGLYAPVHGIAHEKTLGRELLLPTPATSSATPYSLAQKGRLVHADASLQLRVKNHDALSKATTKATQIVGGLGGWAQSVHYQTFPGYGSAVLALRVPVDHVKKAVTRLLALGTVLDQQLSTQDLNQRVAQEGNRITTLRETVVAYEQALKNPSLSPTEQVALKVKLQDAKRSLDQSRNTKAATLASAATANVALTLTTQRHAAVVPHHKQGRLGRMLGDAAHFLALEGIILLYALVVLSPFLLIGGLTWGLLRERRRRDERRLLAGA